MTKKDLNEMSSNCYDNIMNNRVFTKGVKDSSVKYKVLATREGNYFSPETCYFAYIKDLPFGTCYVDSEKA